jgi:hypothetical protein
MHVRVHVCLYMCVFVCVFIAGDRLGRFQVISDECMTRTYIHAHVRMGIESTDAWA